MNVAKFLITSGADMEARDNTGATPLLLAQSQLLTDAADRYARRACGQGVEPIPSSNERKEVIAHKRQPDMGIKHGLIGVWSAIGFFRRTFFRP